MFVWLSLKNRVEGGNNEVTSIIIKRSGSSFPIVSVSDSVSVSLSLFAVEVVAIAMAVAVAPPVGQVKWQ